MPKPPYFERVPSEEIPLGPPLEKGEAERSLEMARPRRGELEMPDLTGEEKAHLRSILEQAKAAEAEGRLEEALEFYQKVKEEFLAMKEKKEKEKRGSKTTIAAQTPEGKEISFDMKEIRADSDAFYRAHSLEEFADALPEEIRLSPESEARLRETMEMGFDRAILLPGRETQDKAGVSKLKAELADKELPGLSGPDQYTPSYLDSAVKDQGKIKEGEPSEKRQAAYLLLYQSGPIPEETRGKTFSQAEEELNKLFGQGKWNGLTLEEYLLLQRKEFEERKDHSFDAYSADASKSQWTWLLDSRAPSGCVGAGWDPEDARVHVDWYEPEFAYPNLGARPAVVVPIL